MSEIKQGPKLKPVSDRPVAAVKEPEGKKERKKERRKANCFFQRKSRKVLLGFYEPNWITFAVSVRNEINQRKKEGSNCFKLVDDSNDDADDGSDWD